MPYEKVVDVHDCYIDVQEYELFLCSTSRNELKWLPKEKINIEQYNKVLNQNKKLQRSYTFGMNDFCDTSCNTDKTSVTPCEIKCRTRGIVLLVSNCGITISYREIYGSESLTQVAYLIKDTFDLFEGFTIFF